MFSGGEIWLFFLVPAGIVFVLVVAVSIANRAPRDVKTWMVGTKLELLEWREAHERGLYQVRVRCPDGRIIHGWVRYVAVPGVAPTIDVRWELAEDLPPGFAASWEKTIKNRVAGFPVIFPTEKKEGQG